MQRTRCLIGAPLLFALALLPAGKAPAAASFDGCAGFIDAIPATIATRGTWCLRRDLSTAIASGNAITIAANNVTIDCNDFKLGGLAAGPASLAVGILAENRQNVTVRGCSIRGFDYGIQIEEGAGHLVEDNRLDNNLRVGILAIGDNSVVRRNRVYDTGGPVPGGFAHGILGAGDIYDNIVAGVFGDATNVTVFGIYGAGNSVEIRGNRIRGLAPSGTGVARGIRAFANSARVIDNQVSATAPTDGTGIDGAGAHTTCTGNSVTLFEVAYLSCEVSSGNTFHAP